MPIDLAPHDLVLQDWGRRALLRRAANGHELSSAVQHPVTVIPQTVHLAHTDMIAAVQGETRTFLIQSSELPESLRWLDCELIIDRFSHRVISAEDSGTGGWVLLETHALPPRAVV